MLLMSTHTISELPEEDQAKFILDAKDRVDQALVSVKTQASLSEIFRGDLSQMLHACGPGGSAAEQNEIHRITQVILGTPKADYKDTCLNYIGHVLDTQAPLSNRWNVVSEMGYLSVQRQYAAHLAEAQEFARAFVGAPKPKDPIEVRRAELERKCQWGVC